jgi:hypothetical protein
MKIGSLASALCVLTLVFCSSISWCDNGTNSSNGNLSVSKSSTEKELLMYF